MSRFKEKYWWVFPIWRNLLYCLWMAVLWALPVVILGAAAIGISYFGESPVPPSEDGMDIPAWVFFSMATVFFGLFSLVSGAIPGLCAGIFAPASEPVNPLKSKFLRRVGSRTFWVLLFSILFFYINALVLSLVIDQSLNLMYLAPFYDPYVAPVWIVGSCLGYCYGIYWAIRNALIASH